MPVPPTPSGTALGNTAGGGPVGTTTVPGLTGGWWWWAAPLVAAVGAITGLWLGWRGVDLPAQLYRVMMFRRHGLALWDNQWYGGHWTLDYSVVFPPVAASIGVHVTTLVSAVAAAWGFDRLVVGHFGRVARVGSVVFAVGTVVQVAIGQLPFLMGEALAMWACWAASRRRWGLAVLLAVATSLTSPLAGAFLALAGLAWLLSTWPAHRLGLMALLAGVAIPVGVLTLLFPGQGSFPFPLPDFLFEVVACTVMWALAPPGERALRNAALLYTVATTISFVLPTPVGGNVGRLGECLAIPLAACLMWPLRRWLLIVIALPMLVWQWTPAWGAITDTNSRQPSTHKAFYTPLLSFLEQHRRPLGRVEIVPTEYHWEAAYVAPSFPLARGWERQLDIADNPIFYTAGALTPAAYDAWLLDNGVRYVALPDAPLDFAGTAEAALVTSGVPGLQRVWSDAHWRVYKVLGSHGIVDGPARLVSLEGSQIVLDASGPGYVVVRVRASAHWTVDTGTACVADPPGARDRWLELRVPGPGAVELGLHPATGGGPDC